MKKWYEKLTKVLILNYQSKSKQTFVILTIGLMLLITSGQQVLADSYESTRAKIGYGHRSLSMEPIYWQAPDILNEQEVLGRQNFDLDDFYGSGAGGSLKNISLTAASVDGASSGDGGNSDPSLAEISRMLNNPLAYLWMLYVENDTTLYQGGPFQDDQVINTTIIQPVMPIPLTDDLNLINRPIIPLISAELPAFIGDRGSFPDDILSGGGDFLDENF